MDKKARIFEFIKNQIEERGYPPTIREIGRKFNISSTNGVRYFLNRLEEEGLIERIGRKARGIRIVGKGGGQGVDIPILGRVPAGEPIFTDQFIENFIVVDRAIAGEGRIFGVRVRGDSMTNAGIFEGDIAIVKENPRPNSGQIVVALIDGEVTLKRFIKRGKRYILKPENEKYKEIVLNKLRDKEIKIIGAVVGIVRRF